MDKNGAVLFFLERYNEKKLCLKGDKKKVELKPGQSITVQKKGDRHKYEAVVLSAHYKQCSAGVFHPPPDAFAPGDELVVELTEWEDALYVFQAVITNVTEGREPTSRCLQFNVYSYRRIQRRQAERMAVSIPAEYAPLPAKKFDREMPQGLIHNISCTGVLMSVQDPLDVGEELLLLFEIALSKEKVPIGTQGRVVRVHEEKLSTKYPYSYGIRFKNPERLLAV